MAEEYKIYVSVSGRHGGWPAYVTATSLHDPAEAEVWCDYGGLAKLRDGTQPFGIYQAISLALRQVPDDCRVLVFAPQSFVKDVFSVTREERQKARYRGSNKKVRPNADLLRSIDDETERRGIVLSSRDPELHREYEMLDAVRTAAAQRLIEATQAADNKFEA
ncbi:hypothetical protein QE369_004229 [Agrobacterium larrymoorei]|uniref:Uncharacterized protein n=1 Tax=Agrobacterium larrymoorei TaxID=160699 RepID=A0AAJ2BFK6_9HYPH|nr:hypothetical protein [Agrobacterium larrymoorei]MDR6104032.1 hypothetical protein [Agrobacterium larrymoorei]